VTARSRLGAALLPAGLVAAVVVGIVGRFVASSPLWLDEALSVNIAALPVDQIPDALRRDGHPPLYYWLLHGWMAVFGQGDVAVRALSGVLSVLALPLAWLVGQEVGGTRVARLALVVVALSPFAVRYATEARMYSLVMLLVLAGWLALVHVLRGGGLRWLVLLGVCTAMLLWSHYWSLYLLVATGAVVLWQGRRPSRRSAVVRALLAMGIGAATFVLWVPSLLEQVAHTGTPWAEPSRPTQVMVETLDALGGGAFAEARTYGILLALVVLIAICSEEAPDGRLLLVGRVVLPLRPATLVLVGTVLVGSGVALLGSTAFHPRYASVFVPLILVLAAVGLARRGAGALTVTAGVALVLLALAGIGYNVVWQRTQSEDHAERILADLGDEDVVVACPDQLGPSLERALSASGGPTPIPYPTAGDPRFVDWRDYAERNDAADPLAFAADVRARAGEGAIWLVWNSTYKTFEGDCEALAAALGEGRTLTTLVPSESRPFEPSMLYRFE
jgi:uncharacterized membrane protein